MDDPHLSEDYYEGNLKTLKELLIQENNHVIYGVFDEVEDEYRVSYHYKEKYLEYIKVRPKEEV